MTHLNLLDTSNELHIHRYGNGIKLIRPDHKNKKNIFHPHDTGHTVASVLQLPFNVFFHNTESVIQNINEISADTCGFDSGTHAITKTMFDVTTKEFAIKAIQHDKEVINTKKTILIEEDIIRSRDDQYWQGISVKSPWYNDYNKIIGLFGFTIVLGVHQLASSLKQITELGLINLSHRPSNCSQSLSIEDLRNQLITATNQYFSKRETECLFYLLRGKSARETSVYLNLSKRTIEHYLEALKEKLFCRRKSEIVVKLLSLLK